MDWFFELETQYKVTLVGIVITAIVSIASLYFSVKNNKAVHYVNAVTQNRVEWISSLRKKCAEFIALVNIDMQCIYGYEDDDSNEKISAHMMKCREIKYEIVFLLNFKGSIDKKIADVLDSTLNLYEEIYHKIATKEDIPREQTMKYQEYLESLKKYIRICTKFEWNRVKIEATGSNYGRRAQKFDLNSLYLSYDNEDFRAKKINRYLFILTGSEKFLCKED
jgi:hypothetical protein